MKKRLLIAILACIMCFSFISCVDNGGDSSSSSQGGQTSSYDSGYDLGSYENENEEQWWDGSNTSSDSGSLDDWNETIPY